MLTSFLSAYIQKENSCRVPSRFYNVDDRYQPNVQNFFKNFITALSFRYVILL